MSHSCFRLLPMRAFNTVSRPSRERLFGKSSVTLRLESPIEMLWWLLAIWAMMLLSLRMMVRPRGGGGGGTSILKVSGTCRWQGYDFAIIAIKTGCLNQPNHWHRVSKSAYLATGTDYSVYNRVAFPPTMFMTGPRSRHAARRDATRRCVRDQYSHDP